MYAWLHCSFYAWNVTRSVPIDWLLQMAEYMQKMDALEEKFQQRSIDFQRAHRELKTIKHFRKIKANMEEELISVLHL